MLILYSKLIRNVAALAILIRFNDDSWQWLTFSGHPVYEKLQYVTFTLYLTQYRGNENEVESITYDITE